MTLTITSPSAPSKETVKPLKLSEAIRFGAMVTSQAFGNWGDEHETCGLGAAQVGFGDEPDGNGVLMWILDHFGTIMECPRCPTLTPTVKVLVMHMNDDHRVPREKIADYLAEFGL